LAKVGTRYGWRLHAYCLMTNHSHLLIETPQPNISRGMQHFHGAYGQAFNHKHGHTGHLFQGRFHSVLVETQEQLLELARYIVLNPVRAGLCAYPDQWPWSSHTATLAARPDQSWLLAQFGSDPELARASYRQFVTAWRPRARPP